MKDVDAIVATRENAGVNTSTIVTIIPEPCGRVMNVKSTKFAWVCSDKMRCTSCKPLGTRLQDALYDDSCGWGEMLAANLAIAALLAVAAARGPYNVQIRTVSFRAGSIRYMEGL